jgi:Na+-translocating ferredoxin:NAD+ oxidoreductase RnfG subunit
LAICSRRIAVLLGLAAAGAPGAAAAQGLTQEEALRLAFPAPATIERRTAFLSDAQLDSARALAGRGVEVDQRIVTYYVGNPPDGPLGVAYFDSHRVRTLKEVVMVVVAPAGAVRQIEILRFGEPPEYKATEPWLAQFPGRALSQELSLKGAVANLTGATLTSNAVVACVRRVLALHALIHPLAVATP